MESEGNAAAAGAGAGAGAGNWEAPNGVIVLPAGSAAPRFLQQEPHYLRRKREMEREQQDAEAAGADPGVLGLDLRQPPEKVYYKTRLCEKFEAGKCAYEDGCTFAHGFDELRPPLPVPTALIRRRSPLRPRSSSPGGAAADGSQVSGGYLRVCFEFRDTGACHRGDRCAFAHASVAAGTCALAPRLPIRVHGGRSLPDLADRALIYLVSVFWRRHALPWGAKVCGARAEERVAVCKGVLLAGVRGLRAP
jgi:hypothetical protein